MDKDEKEKIAYALLKLVIAKNILRLPTPNNFRREIGNIASQIDISKEKLMQFTQEICNETFEAWLKTVFKR